MQWFTYCVLHAVVHISVPVVTPASDDEDFSEGERSSDSDSNFDDADSDFSDCKTKGRSKAKAAAAKKRPASVTGRKGVPAPSARKKGGHRGREVAFANRHSLLLPQGALAHLLLS